MVFTVPGAGYFQGEWGGAGGGWGIFLCQGWGVGGRKSFYSKGSNSERYCRAQSGRGQKGRFGEFISREKRDHAGMGAKKPQRQRENAGNQRKNVQVS